MSEVSVNAHIKQGVDTETQRVLIARFISENPGATIYDVENYLQIPQNKFSGRLTLLRSEGIIYIGGVKHEPSGKDTSRYYYESSPNMQKLRAMKYEDEIFAKDLRRFANKWKNKIPTSFRAWCINKLNPSRQPKQINLF